VLAEAQAVFVVGSLMSRRIECRRSMHDWIDVASDAFAGIFRGAAEIIASQLPNDEMRARTVK
jgi:hypothetical protein